MRRAYSQCVRASSADAAAVLWERRTCASTAAERLGAGTAIRSVLLALGLLLAAFGSAAQSVRPIIVTPAQPVAGDLIEVAFDRNPCELIVDLPTQADVVRLGSAIDVVVDGFVESDPLQCNLTPARARFVVGALPVGSYSVRVVIRDFLPPFTLFPPSATGTITVNAVPVPALGVRTLALLSFLVFLGGWFAMMRKGSCAWTCMLGLLAAASTLVPNTVVAQLADPKPVYITLKPAGAGVPTPEMVVEQWDFSAGSSPPLLGLSAGVTAETGYLLPVRASGQFLGYLLANPDSPRALLERTIIVWYVPGANIANALTALRSDPNVLAASEPLPFELPVPVGSSSVLQTGAGGGSQSWVDAMALPEHGRWRAAGA